MPSRGTEVMDSDTRSEGWVVGWKLSQQDRASLLDTFPPRYARTVADHVTLKPHVGRTAPLPKAVSAEIVGRADDGKGVEALVVELDGSVSRPDGGTFHVTWSLAPGRKPRESNDVIARFAWQPLAEPMPVRLVPARFR